MCCGLAATLRAWTCHASLPVGGGCPAGCRLPAGVVARRVGPGWLGDGGFWEGHSRGIVDLSPFVLPAQSPQCIQNPLNVVKQKICQVWCACQNSNTSFPNDLVTHYATLQHCCFHAKKTAMASSLVQLQMQLKQACTFSRGHHKQHHECRVGLTVSGSAPNVVTIM